MSSSAAPSMTSIPEAVSSPLPKQRRVFQDVSPLLRDQLLEEQDIISRRLLSPGLSDPQRRETLLGLLSASSLPWRQETCSLVFSVSLDLCAKSYMSLKDLTQAWNTLLISHGFRPSLKTLSEALEKLESVSEERESFLTELTERLWACGVFDGFALTGKKKQQQDKEEEEELCRIFRLCGRGTLSLLQSLESRVVTTRTRTTLRLAILEGLLRAEAFEEVSVRVRESACSWSLKELHVVLRLLSRTVPSSEFALHELLPLLQRRRSASQEGVWTEETYVLWMGCCVTVGNTEVASSLWDEAQQRGVSGQRNLMFSPFVRSA